MDLILVPKQAVVVSGRRRQTVGAFAITSRPITAPEFALFAIRTGYVTDAERHAHEFTVYDNPCVNGVPFDGWATVPALFVSRADAAAFCGYHRLTLPTPSQWLAFVSYVEEKGLFSMPKRTKVGAVPQSQAQFSGCEWLNDPNNMVGRPPMVQLRGVVQSPAKASDMFEECESDAGDMSINFRVVVRGAVPR